MPESTTAAALLAFSPGTSRIAMATPIAQNTPCANPVTSRAARMIAKFGDTAVTRLPTAMIANSVARSARRFTVRLQATRNGTPTPAEMP